MCLLQPASGAAGDDSLCARVKIEIRQELTLERQAFDARMTIHNGLSHIRLENVNVNVSFTDEDGAAVLASSDPNNTDAIFFIRVDDKENIDDVQGQGVVEPSTTAEIHWLIIPSPGAADGRENGSLYYVGASLSYTMGGEADVFEAAPDYIHVKPLPQLTLDYFLPIDVYGDDAFTDEIEPPIPFSLGLRVSNNGVGTAKQVALDSGQPEITKNEQELLIGFEIVGGEVNGQPAPETLLVTLGDIAPGEAAAARWIMTCSLSGQFVTFNADFSHSDELGGALTSLLEADEHLLVRDVLVDLPGRDAVRDFLARDGDLLHVYETDNTETGVPDLSASASLQPGGGNGDELYYTLASPIRPGFSYVRLPDPTNGQKELIGARRSDNKDIKSENVWQSKTRDDQNQWQYFVNLFDADTTGSSTLTFADAPERPHAPVLQFIPDRIGVVGAQLSFIVEASDADGTTPLLAASPLPAGTTFIDQGDGTGVFDWTPMEGQAGVHGISFTASDGALEDSRHATLTIRSVHDTDGDGMPDAWETAHFGILDRDGSGDFDGDGISDLDEFLYGTDPGAEDHAPAVPVIASPADAATVAVLAPTLTVVNSVDPDGDEVVYEFEVFPIPGMALENTPPTCAASRVPAGETETSWTVPDPLEDNRAYFWRVRASDGAAASEWAVGAFMVDTANDPPGPFHVSAPANGADVDAVLPALSVTNAADPDGDALLYTFEVYADNAMEVLIASAAGIPGGADGATSWTADAALEELSWHYWRAIASDGRGGSAETALATFFVDATNPSPDAPAILSPAPGALVEDHEVDLTATNAQDPDGDALVYLFQLDAVPTFDGPATRISDPVSEGAGATSWPSSALEEDARYFWRVKASDGSTESPWSPGNFFVSAANDAPPAPVLVNPGRGAWVETPAPSLSVHPCEDPEGDALSYRFEVYADEALTDLVAEGLSADPAWMVAPVLPDKHWFYWRTRAEDARGLAGPWMAAAPLFVNDDGIDEPPVIAFVEPAGDPITNAPTIPIRWEDDDPDDNADISLYYDTDDSGADGVLIASGIEEDDEGDAATWDATDVEDGIYYIYAVITDGETTAVVYAPSSLTIDRTPPVVQADPAGGAHPSAFTVALAADEAAAIHYTLDGADPTVDSPVYASPIDIAADAVLRFMAVDPAGNQGPIVEESYTIAPEEIEVRVETDKERPLAGVRVYAFTGSGSYTGKYAVTDATGVGRFDIDALAAGEYKFRADYLGGRFWTDPVSLPAAGVELIIPEETATVNVSVAGGSVSGVRVYLFTAGGAYLGVYRASDENGDVFFDLPVGESYKFRADVLGGQYWSDPFQAVGGVVNLAPMDAGGGLLRILVEKEANSPMAGIRLYLFKESGSYLGLYGNTDAEGVVAFTVPEGSYKVRVDYLGRQFWSEAIPVATDTLAPVAIPHQRSEILLTGVYQGESEPIPANRVYLFTGTGAYVGRSVDTDENGKAWFDLPEKLYKVRTDYLGRRLWSEPFTWGDAALAMPMAEAGVVVTGAGQSLPGVKVYVFTESGAYLSRSDVTDDQGVAYFRLPEGAYTFRADHQGAQYWSDAAPLAPDQINPVVISTGGGSFTLTVKKSADDPLPGVNCFVFNGAGAYLSLFGASGGEGRVGFELADGEYLFRADHLGSQFWSEAIVLPDRMAADLIIPHEIVEVATTAGSGPAPGVRVNLFSGTGAYLGLYETTDSSGRASFELPADREFLFRADILGNQYWSDAVTVVAGADNPVSVDAGGGRLQATVEKEPGVPMTGVSVYLFSPAGTHLGLTAKTDASGVAAFDVPGGAYKVRIDYMGWQFWSEEIQATGDVNLPVPIPHQEVEVSVRGVFQETGEPVEGAGVYLFTPTGSYLSLNRETDVNGKAYFEVPAKEYKVRVDHLGRQFWSDHFLSGDAAVDIPLADAEITVTGAGLPREDVDMYVFTAAGSYLGISRSTDEYGKIQLRLPAGPYTFRVDYQGGQFWSLEEALVADLVNPVLMSVGGGRFTLTVEKGGSTPLAGARCYVFSEGGAYLGMSAATNTGGQAFFDLADGAYAFRVDHLGAQFWSETYTASGALAETFVIDHQDSTILVQGTFRGSSEPLPGLNAHLFTSTGAYVGLHELTDEAGQVVFNLPGADYKVRADYLGGRFWSPDFRQQEAEVAINQGRAEIHVHRSGVPLNGARVYLFRENGAYLNWYENTDAAGAAHFTLPEGVYTFRVDQEGGQHWTPTVRITADQTKTVEVDME